MKSEDLAIIKKLFAKYEKESARPSKGDFSDTTPPSQAKLNTALTSALNNKPNKAVLEIASIFFYDIEEYKKAYDCMQQWLQKDKKTVKPIYMLAEMYAQDLIDYADLLIAIETGLERNINNSMLLWLAYEGAGDEGDDTKRLYYAGELTKITRSPNHYYLYGRELGRNGLYDKAAICFFNGIKKDEKHLECMNGLAMAYLEKLELDDAEDLFERSMKIGATDFAKKNLKYIKAVRGGKSVKELESKRRALWDKYNDMTDRKILAEEQKKRLAERFVGR